MSSHALISREVPLVSRLEHPGKQPMEIDDRGSARAGLKAMGLPFASHMKCFRDRSSRRKAPEIARVEVGSPWRWYIRDRVDR